MLDAWCGCNDAGLNGEFVYRPGLETVISCWYNFKVVVTLVFATMLDWLPTRAFFIQSVRIREGDHEGRPYEVLYDSEGRHYGVSRGCRWPNWWTGWRYLAHDVAGRCHPIDGAVPRR